MVALSNSNEKPTIFVLYTIIFTIYWNFRRGESMLVSVAFTLCSRKEAVTRSTPAFRLAAFQLFSSRRPSRAKYKYAFSQETHLTNEPQTSLKAPAILRRLRYVCCNTSAGAVRQVGGGN
uniref:Uncharacterized protein n=1 Tax=Romanomermis culicivorax TaxID=13658 RepID=A0A915JFV7_ROMCU